MGKTLELFPKFVGYNLNRNFFFRGSMVPQPQRIQTSMTLYSDNLSAIIFLVDDRLNASMGLKKSKKNI